MVAIGALNTRIRPVIPSSNRRVIAPTRLSIHNSPASINIKDQFTKDKSRSIKQLNITPEKDRAGQTTGFQIQLKGGGRLSIPASRLSRDNLVSQMLTSSRELQVSSALDLQAQASGLISQIRAPQSSTAPELKPQTSTEMNLLSLDTALPSGALQSSVKSVEANQAPTPQETFTELSLQKETPTESPKLCVPSEALLEKINEKSSLLEKMKSETALSLKGVEELIDQAQHPKAKRVLKKMRKTLKRLQKSLLRQKPLARQERKAFIAQRALQKMMRKLSKQGTPTEKAQRLQVFANLTRSLSSEETTPKALLNKAKSLFPGQRADLEQVESEMKVEMQALQLRDGMPLVQFLDLPLSPEGLEIFQLMQDIPQKELLSVLAGVDFIDDVLSPGWMALSQDLKTVSFDIQQLTLSPESQALIEKANELAKLQLVPTPEAIQGFEKGALSLIQKFLEILQSLDQDLQMIFLAEFQKSLETKLLDAQFSEQLNQAKSFDSEMRKSPSESILEERLQFLLENIQTQSLV